MELLLVAGSSQGGVSGGGRQSVRPAAGLALTLRKLPGTSGVEEGVGHESSAEGAFSGEVILQPLLVRVYLEGWAAAAQCVRQHLVAASIIGESSGGDGGRPSGGSGDEAPARDAGPLAQLRVSDNVSPLIESVASISRADFKRFPELADLLLSIANDTTVDTAVSLNAFNELILQAPASKR